MTNVARARRRVARALALLAAAAVAACFDKPTAPTEVGPDGRPLGRLAVVAPMNGVQATTIVVEVSAPDISPTMVFNLPVVNGTATGTIAVPAGANRTITVRAFDGVTETHRGLATITIAAGNNAPVSVQLVPLQGNVPITVTFGTIVIAVSPTTALQKVGDTLRYSAIVRDANNNTVPAQVRWATTDTRKLTIDTLGLATMRDTGTASVVATYSTAAAIAQITIQPQPGGPVPVYLKTWVGGNSATGQPNDWINPNNWVPAGVPGPGDSVVIGAAANNPYIYSADTFQVRDLVLRTGAQLQFYYRTLNVLGRLSGEGGIVTGGGGSFTMRAGSTVRGTFNAQLNVTNAVAAVDTVRLTGGAGLYVNGVGASFTAAGHPMLISGTLTVDNGGTFVMANAADSVDVQNVSINSNAASHVGLLTAGKLVLRGDLTGYHYDASGAHTLVIAGSNPGSPQNLYGMNPAATNNPRNVVVANAGGLNVQTAMRVTGTFGVTAPVNVNIGTYYSFTRFDSTVTTVVGSTVVGNGADLRHPTGTANVAGAWSPQYTDFNTAGQTIKAGLQYQYLRLFASQTIADTIRTTQQLIVSGTGTVMTMTAPRHIVVQSLLMQNGGTFVMDNPGDTIEVRGDYSTSGGGSTAGRLTAGSIIVWGNVDGSNHSASGTHELVFANPGTGTQQVYSFNPGATVPTVPNRVKVQNGGGITLQSNLQVADSFLVNTPVPVANGYVYGITAQGPVKTVAGSSIAAYYVNLRHPTGTTLVAGTWSPTFTDIGATAVALKPGLNYQAVRFYAAGQFQAGQPYALTSDLIADGSGVNVTLNGAKVSVGGNLVAQNAAKYTWVDGDTATVNGYVSFNSSVPTQPTGGKLTVLGAINLYGGFTPATGSTFKLVAANATARQDLYTTGGPLSKLEVASPFGLRITNNTIVADSMIVSGTGANAIVNDNYQYTLEVRGAFVTAAGSIVQPYAVNLAGTTSLANVAGLFQPVVTRVYTGTPGLLRQASNIIYNYLQFEGAQVSLADTLNVTGAVAVNNGAKLTFNGHRVRIALGLDLNTNGTIDMTTAGDTLFVGDGTNNSGSQTYFDGGAVSNLGNGVIVQRSNIAFNNVATGPNFTLITTDSGLAVGPRTISIANGNPTIGTWSIRGSNQLVVSLSNANPTVNTLLELQGGTTLTAAYYYNIRVNGNFITAPLSSVTGQYLTVDLGNTQGTQNVSGTYSPASTRVFQGGSYLKPSLAYQYLELNAADTLRGATTTLGDVRVQGTGVVLSTGGYRLSVGGSFYTQSNGILAMAAAGDTLAVSGNATINTPASTLTGGVLRVRGDLNGMGLVSAGTHKVILDSLASGAVQTVIGPSFNRFEVRTNRTVQFNNSYSPVFADTFNLAVPTTVQAAYYLAMTFNGPVVTVPGSIVGPSTSPYLTTVLAHPTGTTNVNGTWSPALTRYTLTGQGFNAALAYQGLEFDVALPLTAGFTTTGGLTLTGNNVNMTLGGNTTVGGGVVVSGTGSNLTLGGRKLTVGGDFTLQSGATWTQNQLGDTLDIGGILYMNAQQGGLLTSGVTIVRNQVAVSSFNQTTLASPGHRLVLAGTAPTAPAVIPIPTGANLMRWGTVVLGSSGSTRDYNTSSCCQGSNAWTVDTLVFVGPRTFTMGQYGMNVVGQLIATDPNARIASSGGGGLVYSAVGNAFANYAGLFNGYLRLNGAGLVTVPSDSSRFSFRTLEVGESGTFPATTVQAAVAGASGQTTVQYGQAVLGAANVGLIVNRNAAFSLPIGGAIGTVRVCGQISQPTGTAPSTGTISIGGVLNYVQGTAPSLLTGTLGTIPIGNCY